MVDGFIGFMLSYMFFCFTGFIGFMVSKVSTGSVGFMVTWFHGFICFMV